MRKCTLIIKDFVNIKFTDLDPEIRHKLNAAVKYRIPGAQFSARAKLMRWDGTVSFCSIGGSSYFNLLDKLLPLLEDYDIEIDDKRTDCDFVFPEMDSDFLNHIMWPEKHKLAGQPIVLEDHQLRIINSCLDNIQSVVEAGTGAGKCQPLWAKIKTPSGWTTIGDIKIGDVISSPDGTETKIIGVYPQGLQNVYKITFIDNRIVYASNDHLWSAYCIKWKNLKHNNYSPWKTITTEQLATHLKTNKKSVNIPLIKHQQQQDCFVPIDPYLFGVILGDGSITTDTIKISSLDEQIITKCRAKLLPDYDLFYISQYDYSLTFKKELYQEERRKHGMNRDGSWNHYKKTLEYFNLYECKSNTKFIPSLYLNSISMNQKLELIRGLLDTDGHVGKNGGVSFSSVSEQLAKDVSYLIRSIGGIAKICKRIPVYTYNGVKKSGQMAYTVHIRYHSPKDLLSLDRKRNRISDNYQYSNTLKLQIKSIEFFSKEECQCIRVDNPNHLYITDDFVITHNTICTAVLSSLVEPYGRSLVIVPNKSLVTQTERDYKNIGLDVGVYYGDRKEWNKQHTIATWQSLSIYSKNTKEGIVEIPLEEFIEGVVCVICDESHKAKSAELKSLLTGPFAHIPIRWGLTGTIPKEEHDAACLLVGIGPKVAEVTTHELQEIGFLADCDVEIVQTNDDHVKFSNYVDEHKFLLSDEARLKFLAQYLKILSESGNTLVLVDRVEFGKTLEKLIEDSKFIYGVTKNKNRQIEYDSFNEMDNKVTIATYGIAAEGISIDRIFNLVFIEPGKSFTRTVQTIGRGLRTAQDKQSVRIKDLCSSLKYSKRHLAKRKTFYTEKKFPFAMKKVNYLA